MTYYKPLTPEFRKNINDGINQLIGELNTCQPNILVSIQKQSLEELSHLIERLPDGYLMPMKQKRRDT